MVQGNRGFTLVEVLASLGLFAVVLAGLPALLLTSIRANASAMRTTAATTFAQDKLEEIRNTAYVNVMSGKDQVTETRAAPTTQVKSMKEPTAVTWTYDREWTVASGPTAMTKKIVVTVSWTDYAAHKVALAGIIAG